MQLHLFEASVESVVETPEEIDKAQVDLIDSIAEVSLAEKHLNKPLSSISEGLTILEIANFTSILFKNDGTKFNETLDAVDSCGGREAAYEVFHAAISPKVMKRISLMQELRLKTAFKDFTLTNGIR